MTPLLRKEDSILPSLVGGNTRTLAFPFRFTLAAATEAEIAKVTCERNGALAIIDLDASFTFFCG